MSEKTISIVSFGGGVNSTAMLIGMHECGLRPDAILFADTGGEKPETYRHVAEMQQWCLDNGMPEITGVHYDTSRHGTLEQECINNGTLPSKAFGFGGCSQKWKRYPMDRWVKQWDVAKVEWEAGRKITRLIGIHAGESRRGKIPDDGKFHYEFPLKQWGWNQHDCESAIIRAGIEVPVKSACFFCPSMRKVEVLALHRDHPELFDRAVALEDNANECDGLHVIKGLGRKWSWKKLVEADENQLKLPIYADEQAPMCDTCIDW